MGLTDRDEGRNAEAGREMYETGNWISPTFNYEPRFAKPVLVYWLMSLSYSLFGVNEAAARLPSAVFGIGLILLQYFVVSTLRGGVVGLFAALMLLLNVEIIGLSRMALTDSVLIFFTTLSLYGFWLGFQDERRGRWIWLFYIGMGLGTLAKGPVGVLVPGLTIALYLTIAKQWPRFWAVGHPIAGTTVFALLALPWYVVMWTLHGDAYAVAAHVNTVGRFLSPMEGHGFTIFFYLPVLLLGFFPWSGWLPFAWYEAYRSWRDAQGGERELEWFAASWVVAVFLFFTFSSTRLPHYIGPLFPAAALLTAVYWHRCLMDPATRGVRAAIHTVILIGSLLALGFASIPSLYQTYAPKIAKEFPMATQIDVSAGPNAAAVVLLVGMALVGFYGLSESRRAGAFWAAGASLAMVVLVAIQLTLPPINRYFIAPPQELAYAAGLNLSPDDRLIVYGRARPSSVFYARRKTLLVHPGEEHMLKDHLKQPGRTMILLPASLRSKLPQEAVAYEPILQRFGYLLLANEAIVKIPESALPPPVTIPGH